MSALNGNDDFEGHPHRPARYWLIDRFGNPFGWFNSALEAAEAAKRLWPDQEQDEGREAGTGWDIEVQQ